jgi:hypothetical protein
MRSAAILSVCVALAAATAACGTPGRNVRVALDDAPELPAERLVALDVGRLLTSDPAESLEAERRLTALDEDGRAALLAHAKRIPAERDPRWLHVLDENQALPPLTPNEELAYLSWKVTRSEPVYVMKAQGRLLDLARRQPALMLARLEAGGLGAEAVAVALALAGEQSAVPILLDRYRGARTVDERRAAVEALTRLVGEERRPRLQGSRADIDRDAESIRRWWETKGGER